MAMSFLLNTMIWIGTAIFFGALVVSLGIFYILLFMKTHAATELKAFFSHTPIAIFFQDNKFAEWKPVTPINGVIYDPYYGPFVVSTTYVDKRTKNIMIPLDVDMDGDRSSNIKQLVERFKNVTNNQKSIAELRSSISRHEMDETDKDINNLTSHIKYGNLKGMFVSAGPHNIKSKIEKMVATRLNGFGNVAPKEAIIVFGAIFGIIVIAALILKTAGGV